ncbi:MAG: O-methyltransferase [Nitrososphaerota archaeon]|nr:O-methyltransferase [Nitrososphaerota archaeon]MDG6983199.1 O-methyltransferase [Nitrososphaerota archaeon]
MKPEEVLASIESAAPGRGWPIIGPKRGMILDDVIREHRPAKILEVGTNVGYSAIRMARHLKAGEKVTCVEISEDMAALARSNFAKAGVSDRVEVVVGDALQVLPTLGGSFDMVFLDAVKVDYLTYLKSVERLLHKGSVVVADNVKSFGSEMKPYLDYVRRSGAYSSAYREAPPNWGTGAGDAVEISVRL